MQKVAVSEMQIRAYDGTELFIRKDVPSAPKALFVFVHGLCEHLGRYDYVTGRFNEFGYGVYRFDNRGHGKSGGERGYVENFSYFIDDADTVVETVCRENPQLPVFMLGHSMGGFIAAGYGVRFPGKLAGQIFSGACAIDLPVFEALKSIDVEQNPRLKVPNELSRLICRDPAVVKAYEEDPLVLKQTNLKLLHEVFIKGIAWLGENIESYNYPCLILHGGDDRIVTSKSAEFLYDNIASADKQLKICEGMFHEILNEQERDEVIAEIQRWVAARL